MLDYVQFRYRRAVRSLRRRYLRWLKQSQGYIDRHLRGKWHQLRLVRRFVTIWWLIVVLCGGGLIGQIRHQVRLSQMLIAESGGTYIEAEVGTIKIMNPVLPEAGPAIDVNRLIFSGMTQVDNEGKIAPDLATSWEISPDGRSYTFHLRTGVTWHDGVPFTADDVAFTLAAIQEPDTRSPLAASWQGVKTTVKDASTITFTLPEPLASFLDSTTLGILPRHILGTIDPQTMREDSFNQHPIGTGPFKMQSFAPSADEVTLAANPSYYAGRPKLDGVTFRLYDNAAEALTSYAKHQTLGVGQISPAQLQDAMALHNLIIHVPTLPQEQVLFFRLGDSLTGDATLRSILARSLDRDKIIQAAVAGEGRAVKQPLLPGQLGYSGTGLPAPLSVDQAQAALTAAGWLAGTNGVRQKGSQKLDLAITTLAGSELETAAREIAQQWQPLGAKVTINAVSLTELEQSYIRPRRYQLLLYGVSIGGDPDVYSYWHSSQVNDPGLNLSEYQSTVADRVLESGRILSDPASRAVKYQAFLRAWDSDMPAAVLYQPRYLYGQDNAVMGYAASRLITPVDRFYNIQNWTVRQRWVTR